MQINYMTCKNKYMTPFSGAGVFDLSNISVGHTVTCTRMRGFFIIPTRGRILGSRRPVASEQELAWLVIFISHLPIEVEGVEGYLSRRSAIWVTVAGIPVFYVSHDICLTYIICMSLIWGTYDTRHRIEAYISESQSGLSWMSCLAFLCTWCGRGDISNPSPILNILTYFFTGCAYRTRLRLAINIPKVLKGIMQSTTSLPRYMMAWRMLRYERYQALAA